MPHLLTRGIVRVGYVVAGGLLLYLSIATLLGIGARYLLRSPSRFLFDSASLALGLLVFIVVGAVAAQRGHITLDLLPLRSARSVRVSDVIARVLTIVILTPLALAALSLTARDYTSGMRIGNYDGLPRWLATGAVAWGLLTCLWVAIIGPLRATSEPSEAAPRAPGEPDD